jgi:23S rRNA (adenine2503-C2)-methyltransferase
MDGHDLFGFTRSGLAAIASEILPGGAGLAGRVYADLFLRGRFDPGAYGLASRNADAWKASFFAGWPEIASVRDEEGPDGATRKACLRLADGALIECVLIPMPGFGRNTLCVSSQAGCRMGCAFCLTGEGGFRRNLSAAEIVSQAMAARFGLGWEFRNLVFMGMGEPLDNVDALVAAIRVMNDQNGLKIDAERITVCTCGPPGGIEALGRAGFKRLNLSISLNAADDATRGLLMPVNRSQNLEALAAALKSYPRRRNFVFGVNYCLLPGINDSRAAAAAAAAFCRGLGRTMLNLIPYNPGSRAASRGPTEEEIERFASWLVDEGQPLRRRAARGGSIQAACGQLAGMAG